MARIRTIQPDFPRSPSMGRVSREARLLFVLLWTVVDDEGRCHAAPDDLARVLYPNDFDASMYLLGWLDELENEDCIERYEADGLDYLRIVKWKQHQRIYHPTRSHLPPPPHEELDLSGIRETSGKLTGRDRKMPRDQGLGARSDTAPENCDFRPGEISEIDDGPIVVTQQITLREIEHIRANALMNSKYDTALRAVAMKAQIGLKPSKTTDKNKESDEPIGPSPGDLL
jgi:hypothetical protein